MEPLMQGCGSDVQVLGIGHLAAAVRVELARRGLGLHAERTAVPLVVACSDFHNPASFAEAHRLAREDGSAILCASLEDPSQHPLLLCQRRAALVVDRIAGFLT